jgi:transposase
MSYYENLKEDVTVAAQRIKYIKMVKQYRSEGYHIFYQDETWVNKNMAPVKCWIDENRRRGRKVPQGKGERSIICHIGSEEGFILGAKLVFRGSKSLKEMDYHTEMNAKVFFHWMETKVFQTVPERSVVVVDRATYHTTLTEESKPAKSTFKKLEFAEWLVSKNVDATKSVNDYMKLTRVELAELCKLHKPKPVYSLVKLEEKYGVKVLFLPVGHPELNPIELVWSRLKQYISTKNEKFSLKEVEELAHQFFDTCDNTQ